MGDRAEVRNLVNAVRHGQETPHWNQLRRTVEADHAARESTLAKHGVGSLLAGLPGVVAWDGEILTFRYLVDRMDRTLFLSGRGITLILSYFCMNAPVTLIDPTLPPMLVHPAQTKLASLTMATGDPVEAAAIGTEALDAAGTIRSRRAAEDLRELARYAARHPKVGDAAILRHRITNLVLAS